MRSAVLLVLFGIFIPSISIAEPWVLIDQVPPNVSAATTVGIVKAAFAKRGWKITASTSESVSAEITRRMLRSRATITLSGGTLVVDAKTVPLSAPVPGAGNPVLNSLPSNWAANLRGDISLALAAANRL